jgi:hypothetical protein
MRRKIFSLILQANIFCCEDSLFSIRLQKRDSVIIVLKEVRDV